MDIVEARKSNAPPRQSGFLMLKLSTLTLTARMALDLADIMTAAIRGQRERFCKASVRYWQARCGEQSG